MIDWESVWGAVFTDTAKGGIPVKHLVLALSTIGMLAGSSIVHAEDHATGGGKVFLGDAMLNDRTIEGRLDASELTYVVGYEDYIYRKGDAVLLRGAVSFSGLTKSPNKPPALFLKVTAFDLVGDKTQFAPLHYAFISAKGESFAGKESGKFTCEDGGVCIAYSIFDNPNLFDAILIIQIFLTPSSMESLRSTSTDMKIRRT
jgi:hypothetical protein